MSEQKLGEPTIVRKAAGPEVSAEPRAAVPRGWAADIAVWLLWLLTAATTVVHHEAWADEAQSWLIARDLGLRELWFHELRYEGTPGLWHTLLWLAQRLFHLPYAAMGAPGLLLAAAGAVLLLARAPFPRPLRWLMLFSYFLIYQYAVIARSYVLLPLLAFSAALCFRDKDRPVQMAVVLALLANVSLHGGLLAFGIGCAYLVQGVCGWQALASAVRRRYLLAALGLVLLLIAMAAVLWPPPDVNTVRRVHRDAASILDSAWLGINGAFFDSTPLTVIWLLLLAAWSYGRRAKGLLPVGLLLLLGGFYGLYGAPHHQGTILVATLAGLWIAWPEGEPAAQPWLQRTMVAALFCMMGYQAVNAAYAIRNDYLYPYCGAADAAQYLKSVGADKQRIMGYGYAMVAVEAYFDHNIQVNRPTAYFHHELRFFQPSADPMAELKGYQPDFVVIPCLDDCEQVMRESISPFMRDAGFSLAHLSDGWLFFKRGADVRQTYLVYRRKR